MHDLASIKVHSSTFANYVCICGAKGSATMATHLASLSEIERRAVKNHEMHQVRALIKEAHELRGSTPPPA